MTDIQNSDKLALGKILNLTNPQKVRNSVMPAKAGIQNCLNILDSRLRGNDSKG
jgi:hypothetical protein